ncbi:MAG: intracellular septation protein [Phenylobacterium sp.]|uniref:inner membrane-spanning protein YciB n=1 Tax=Phenylobacterium sp. TaxID=1871053 RepID=UPI0025F2F196|nr:septation protein IspZ [Phenylobacterium sp.]MBI1199388.1 intracellular septation protein [Phenylobacterium sp.]
MGNLMFAAKGLLQDLAPTLVFALLVALKVDPVITTAAAMAVGVVQIIALRLLGRQIAPLQWASLGLVLVFGTASLLAHDVRFLMAKPTLIYAIVGVVMLKRGWMLRYLPPVAEGRGERAMIAFGYVWAGLMFVSGAANLVFAIWFSSLWPLFLAVFPTVSKVALFAIQYVTMRVLIVRQVRAEQGAAQAEPQAA